MRLTHIKLAGFKSFVDPTTIPVPGQLVAVIGPNGCGKSNVIDAVRWVLGESSARQLRGESMQDVIFNGATTRKPVSRASVELVFDNADHALAGSWGQYAEVAIKRVLTRQGESSYYINGQQVRRRDITDLFLGTGVGARGYAVIEQGMISRIIEARPEELRAYLEEAAGVSRYKERRRETEHRLRDTRDNLERIADLEQELARQVEHLSAQAEVAGRYHDLRHALTDKQNLLALARREEAAAQEAAARAELARIETEEAAQEAEQTHLETALDSNREAHFSAGEAVHVAQQALYEASALLSRLEEQQRHQGEQRARVERETLKLQAERQQLAETRAELAAGQDEWQHRLEEAQLAEEEAQLAAESGADALPDAEAHFAAADAALTQLASREAALTRARDLAGQSQRHHADTLTRLAARRRALDEEHAALALPEPEAVGAAQAAADAARAHLATQRARLATEEEKLAALAREAEQLAHALADASARHARADAEAGALAALIAREAAGDALEAALSRHPLGAAPQLWQSLEVTPNWQRSVEGALGPARLAARVGALPDFTPPAPLAVVDTTAGAPGTAPATALAAHARADAPFGPALAAWLTGLYCAESLDDALARRGELAPGAAWVTPEGHRVDALSVHYHGSDAGGSLLERKAELADARARADTCLPEMASLTRRRDALAAEQSLRAEALRALKGALTRQEEALASASLEAVRLEQMARQGAARGDAIAAERARILDETQHAQGAIDEAAIEAEEAALALEDVLLALSAAREAREAAARAQEAVRGRAREDERRLHACALALQDARQRSAELARRAEEAAAREEALAERLQTLLEEAETVEETVAPDALYAALAEREAREAALATCRDAQNALATQQRELVAASHALATRLPELREARSQWLLRHQEARLNVERYAGELLEAGANEAALREALSDAVKPAALAAEIARLARAIEALGAVNLAALEELSEARTRGDYLAAQRADLTEAMATLEEAIARIDEETRGLLSTTYAAVNAKMSEFFPTLFGGGRAELVLTGDDLLDAGLQIIAQPPGKKNSTIHLLSGGEKALTAMSLVFALFSLNPAPFCLLDEVDAPLDDANTGRFCELVKHMSANTQFLYISHNRLTMEMAEQLVGVTMQEKGVSRIVAVDIVEALRLRETS
ncbi:chromosome segregation protein SMC [Crenobacter intestini]|uniref:Chromosome partition protein Smc n=1 Tax=Crenobacter intestini TaxID=2563443 RepID=A0A4T0UZU0_9NEIS|nr:chromosome segregation protein SMC [Crenobacter intestini]TIC84749.1 chromosome segregation protein SMC [Crenobacter intestini]